MDIQHTNLREMRTLLKELVEKNRCLFLDRAENWQEAIRLSCQPLVADGTVDETYADELIENVNKHGAYIVLIPGFAMPHSMEGSKRANGTGISFMKLKEPVHFEPGDPEKDASVFFTLAATDSDEHLKNMRRLFTVLSNEDLLVELSEVESTEDLLSLHKKYNDQPDEETEGKETT